MERCEKVFHPNASRFDSGQWSEHFGCDFCYLWTLHVNDYVEVLEAFFPNISSTFVDTLHGNQWKIEFDREFKSIGGRCWTIPFIRLTSLRNCRKKATVFVSCNFLDTNGAIYAPTGQNGVNKAEMIEKSELNFDFKFPFKPEQHLGSIRYYDTLRILLRMWTFPAENQFKWSRAPPVFQNLGWLLDEPAFADVTLEVGSSHIMAHRAVLAARSTVFREQLLAPLKGVGVVRLNLSDYSPSVVHGMLKHMYTDVVPDVAHFEEGLDLIYIAHAYNLEPLKYSVGCTLRVQLDSKNVVDALVCSIQCDCQVLRDSAVCYLKKTNMLLVGNPKIEKLAKTDLKEVLAVLAATTKK